MGYLILESNGYTNSYTFQEDVNARIAEGYIPIGGISVIPKALLDKYDNGVTFYQAMYKEPKLSVDRKLHTHEVITILGIKLEANNEPYTMERDRLICYPFTVLGPEGVTRDDINKLVGEEFLGKTIQGVESFAIQNQMLKPIAIAIAM